MDPLVRPRSKLFTVEGIRAQQSGRGAHWQSCWRPMKQMSSTVAQAKQAMARFVNRIPTWSNRRCHPRSALIRGGRCDTMFVPHRR